MAIARFLFVESIPCFVLSCLSHTSCTNTLLTVACLSVTLLLSCIFPSISLSAVLPPRVLISHTPFHLVVSLSCTVHNLVRHAHYCAMIFNPTPCANRSHIAVYHWDIPGPVLISKVCIWVDTFGLVAVSSVHWGRVIGTVKGWHSKT